MLFWGELDLIFTLSSLKVIIVRFWIDLIFAFFYMQVIHMVDSFFTFFCMQVIHKLFWGELDLIYTLSSLKVIIVMFWIDLIFAFFYMQVITKVFWIVFDLISIFV